LIMKNYVRKHKEFVILASLLCFMLSLCYILNIPIIIPKHGYNIHTHAQALFNGTPYGIAYIYSSLGNDSSDATTAIISALASNLVIEVDVPVGTYRHTGLGVIPAGKTLKCLGIATDSGAKTVLKYMGSGTSMSRTGRARITGCQIEKNGSRGSSIGIAITGTGDAGGEDDHLYFKNWNVAYKLDGAVGGVYFQHLHDFAMVSNDTGVLTTSSGGNQANHNWIDHGMIHDYSSKGIFVDSGSRGNIIDTIDFEFPATSSSGTRQVDLAGPGNTVSNCWFEFNSGTFTTATGLYVTSTYNTLVGNKFPQNGVNWTNYTIAASNTVSNPYDATGAFANPVPDYRLSTTLFARLPATNDGGYEYCTDCAVTSGSDNTCVGSGTGAFAYRINGVWKCVQ
jgi:hypothetical protein